MLMIAPTLSRLLQDQGAVAAVVICLNVVSAVVVMVLRVCHSAEVMLDALLLRLLSLCWAMAASSLFFPRL